MLPRKIVTRQNLFQGLLLATCFLQDALYAQQAPAAKKAVAESKNETKNVLKTSAAQLLQHYVIKPIQLDTKALQELEARIGYQFKDKKLLLQAFTTAQKDPDKNYERHEFLGDKILDAVIAQILVHEYKNADPGALTDARQALVSQEPLAALCLKLGLHHYVQASHSTIPLATLGDLVESTIGALYEDGGQEAAQDFIIRHFLPMLQNKACPRMTAEIIKQAAKARKCDIEYVWTGNAWNITLKAGTGAITTNSDRGNGKGSVKRLALYLAEREFITKKLDAQYCEQLVRLATDADYKSLDKAPALKLSWSIGVQENFRERLHTLYQMLGRQTPEYSYQEDPGAENKRFVCQLRNHLDKPVVAAAATKAEATEAVAEIVYKELQKAVLVNDAIQQKSRTLTALDEENPVVSVHEFCQALQVDAPEYTAYYKEKEGKASIYTCMQAPWLKVALRGPLRATAKSSKKAVAARLVLLLRHFAAGALEAKKLHMFSVLQDNEEPISTMLRLCQVAGLDKPVIETHVSEGPVSDGLQFESTITVSSQKWGVKRISGPKGSSKAAAENSAAKSVLNYMVNKMLKDEVTLARA